MNNRSLKDVIEERFETDSLQLPVFNRVALELQKLKQSGNVSMKRVSDLIMKDQSLASRVLQMANSPFYGGLKRVETVSGAVIRLGMDRVTSLAMVASQLLAHSTRSKILAPYMPALWSRSFVCATGGRWVAQQSGHGSRAEDAFLAGLMHDIGELFLIKILEKIAQDRRRPITLTDPLIKEILEAMHEGIGYRIMLKWELPEVYARIARNHHSNNFDETDLLLLITRLMDNVCRKLGVGQTADPDIVLAATPEAQILGLKEIKLAQLEVLLEDVVAESKVMV